VHACVSKRRVSVGQSRTRTNSITRRCSRLGAPATTFLGDSIEVKSRMSGRRWLCAALQRTRRRRRTRPGVRIGAVYGQSGEEGSSLFLSRFASTLG
jgi:hypothetical protein